MAMCRIFACFAVVLLFAHAMHAESPQQEVNASTDKVLAVLKASSGLNVPERDQRRQFICNEIEKRIDWEKVSRACLGSHWLQRTPIQQAEFVKLFGEFLKEHYSENIVAYDDLARIEYKDAQIADNNWALVRSVLTTKANVKQPIDYCLEKASVGDDWKIIDVTVNRTSLVKLYRDQLDAIITRYSYEGLLNQLKSKLNPTVVIR